jgi:hypothetical protein
MFCRGGDPAPSFKFNESEEKIINKTENSFVIILIRA